jgi:hypothetical protein
LALYLPWAASVALVPQTSEAPVEGLRVHADESAPRVFRVGANSAVPSVAAAARMARDGDTVEIEAGDYVGDTAVWTQSRLTIRGVNGRPRFIAAGQAAERKAIWVIRGDDIVVEDIIFTGVRNAAKNGAGIRFEHGKLTVRRCQFSDNENGMLVGNDPSMVLEIEDSEFVDNGAGDGYSHNLYVGSIGRLTVQGSYFHRARAGHLFKSRARENLIVYNRLTDEVGGQASYELELPSGGVAFVIGNLIGQNEKTENPTLISFGAEGYRWERNELYLAHNTLINEHGAGGIFLKVFPGAATVRSVNNLLIGDGDFDINGAADLGRSWHLPLREIIRSTHFDYRLKRGSAIVGVARDPGAVHGISLRPTREYRYPVGSRTVASSTSLTPGALQ